MIAASRVLARCATLFAKRGLVANVFPPTLLADLNRARQRLVDRAARLLVSALHRLLRRPVLCSRKPLLEEACGFETLPSAGNPLCASAGFRRSTLVPFSPSLFFSFSLLPGRALLALCSCRPTRAR